MVGLLDEPVGAVDEADALGVGPPPPAGALRDGCTVDGPIPLAEDEPALGVGVGDAPPDGGLPDWLGELGDALLVGGVLVGAVDGPEVEP